MIGNSERELYLERILQVSLDNRGDLSATLIDLTRPFSDHYKIGGISCWDWYEENIFNESRLYKSLGKDDARSVLGIFRRFREVCELLEIKSKRGEESKDNIS